MRYLGVDFGLKKIGLALGEDEAGIVAPLSVVLYKDALPAIKKLLEEEGIREVVIGKPVHVKAVEQEPARLRFIEALKVFATVHEIDERYTTKESQARQAEGDEAAEDAIAAAIILESFFASRKYSA